jgi:hypothetical protein
VGLVAGVAVGLCLVCILVAAAVVWRLKNRRSKPAARFSGGAEGLMNVEAGILPAPFASPSAGASAGPGGAYRVGEATAPGAGASAVSAGIYRV